MLSATALKPCIRFVPVEFPILAKLSKFLKKKGKASISQSLTYIASVFILLYLLLIVLGNLIPVMDSAVPAGSPLEGATTSLTENTQTFFTIAALVGIIGVAVLIINMLS